MATETVEPTYFVVTESHRYPNATGERRFFYKTLSMARKHFEGSKGNPHIYWAGLFEQRSPSHCAVQLDSFCEGKENHNDLPQNS